MYQWIIWLDLKNNMLTKFNKIFKQLKKESGLSDKKLGELLGVSHSTICRWENGQSDIKSNDLIKVAQFFGVTLEYLVGLED